MTRTDAIIPTSARFRPAQLATKAQKRAAAAARAGLDFLVRHQIIDPTDANHGRYPFVFCCRRGRAYDHTTNWSTGVVVEVMLSGYHYFKNPAYLESAQRGIRYLESLQSFYPPDSRMYGTIHEETPQTLWMHPRDASTAAWAMLDFALVTADEDMLKRVRVFGDWYVRAAMLDGYPHWTCRLDDAPWDPPWFGSFHSGTAFFLLKLHKVSGDAAYLKAATQILDHYNTHHLQPDGNVVVIRDRRTNRVLDRQTEDQGTNLNWELMHAYNDDFGALANLAMLHYQRDGKAGEHAERFLRRMVASRQSDGGFGPEGMSIPSATGVILTELLAARYLGLDLAEDGVYDRAASYLISQQIPGRSASAGAFLGFTSDYKLDGRTANTRSGAYAIMALLRYAGAVDGCYYFGKDPRTEITPLSAP